MQKFFILLPVLAALFVLASPIAAAPGDLDSGFGSERIVTVDKDGISGKTIPFAQLGTEAQKQYLGDGIAILPTQDGAMLRAAFQKLEGVVTGEGLWLNSTADADAGAADRFRLVAAEVGRQEGSADTLVRLPSTGTVKVTREVATFIRPGLIEEYTVSMDGVRQDFLVLEQPAGKGELSVILEVNGAQVAAASYGAKLILAASGREIAYSRLHVTDAHGRVLPARFEVTGTSRLSVRVDDAGALYPVRIDPTFSDADWSAVGTGVVGSVAALTVVGSEIYVGGAFSSAGGGSASNIAKWNGSSWVALGSGLNGQVAALAAVGTNVYAGGYFTMAGSVVVSHIAKWDGTAWSALGSGGTSTPVYALAVRGTDLFVGGDFAFAGGIGASGIAKYNGSSWSALGAGISGGGVLALALVGSDLYAGGSFTSAAGVPNTRYLARWNGSSWSAVGTGVNYLVFALAASGTDLYAGGWFSTAGGITVNGIAKWDGSIWNAMGTGITEGLGVIYEVRTLAVNGTDVYAGGDFTAIGGVANQVAKWDGTSWSALGSGVSGGTTWVSALLVAGSNLYVGGNFTSAGGKAASDIARLALQAPAAAPQKVVFCYDQPCPFKIVPDHPIVELSCQEGMRSCIGNSSNHSVKWDPANPMSPAYVSLALRQPYFDAVKKAFQYNGVITGMTFSIGAPQPDAINVYFCPRIPTIRGPGGLLGYAYTGLGRPDRFNFIQRGDVYISYTEDDGEDAGRVETIVHEIGHCLGLVHIDPKNLAAPPNENGFFPQALLLQWNECVMDYLGPEASPSTSSPIKFFAEPAWCRDFGSNATEKRQDFDGRANVSLFADSNEEYYLQKWVERRTPDSGLSPGDYDEMDFNLPDYNACNARFAMATSQTLYNVKVTQDSFTGESAIVGEYASLTPSQWSALQLDLQSQGQITIVESTSPSAPEADVIMVAAPNGQPRDSAIPLSGTVPLEMLQLTGTSTFTTIGVGEVQGTPLATTTAASAVTSGWATLNGEVILTGSTGTAWFEYGPTDTYGRKTYDSSIPSGTGSTSVSFNIGGLLKGTTYHYRLMVTNADGIVYGQDQTFTTPAVTSPPRGIRLS